MSKSSTRTGSGRSRLRCCLYHLALVVLAAAVWAPQGASGCLLGMNRELARTQLMSLLGQYPDLLGNQGLFGQGMMGNRVPGMQGLNGMNGMNGAYPQNQQGLNGMGGTNGMYPQGQQGMNGMNGMNGMGGMGGQQDFMG